MHTRQTIDTDRDPPPEEEQSPGREETHAQRIEQLFLDHNQVLIQFLIARLHSEQDAREVAQEAYVRLLKLDNPDTVSFLRTFLFKTAMNLANDRYKQRIRRIRWERAGELVFFDTSAVSPSAESGIAAEQELDLISAAIEELPAKCRKAFVLHKLRGVSVEDTAEQMHLSIRMIRLYIARAILHCKSKLEEQTGETRKGR